MDRFWSKARLCPNGCLLWTGAVNNWGYGRFLYQGKARFAHRVAWALTHGPIPDGLHVCHSCDRPLCVNPEHLFLGTDLDNTRDMFAKGRNHSRAGTSNGNAKLTESDVRTIRGSPLGHSELGRVYGVSPQTIFSIRRRKLWRHLD
jgi:hypothetical protein